MPSKIILAIMLFFSTASFATADRSITPSEVENHLRYSVLISGETNKRMSLKERMEYYNVSAISLAVVDKGRIAWAKGYGNITFESESKPVDTHTLFQAASVSKPITAFGALILVQQGKISLDEDVNKYLKSWKIPNNPNTQSEKVTLRRLLSHGAGINVDGFPGYSVTSPIPTLVDILNGKKPQVNTEPVRVVLKPGTQFKYSGGGTTIVQLLIEEITGEKFGDWMQKNVLLPLKMLDSTFNQPLSPSQAENAAYAHVSPGKKVPGNWHVYPELAAAGLWSTPSDLAKFILYIQAALKDNVSFPLKPEWVKEMVSEQIKIDDKNSFGLSLALGNEEGDLIFQHKGQNIGFISELYGIAGRDQGVVVLINNDSAWGLMQEITNSVADVYQWPSFKVVEKKKVDVDPARFNLFVGSYQHEKDQVEISRQDDRLFIDMKNGFGRLIELYPQSEDTYFMQESDTVIQFIPKDNELTVIDSTGKAVRYKK